jgi:uncharacterized membrane protein YbhN (UPF0104 family)
VLAFVALLARGDTITSEVSITQLLLGMLAMQPLLLVSTLFYAGRHAILVRRPAAPLLAASEAVVLSAALNLVVPGRLSEAIKATYLRDRIGLPLANGASAIAVERIMDIAFVAAIATAGAVGIVAPSLSAWGWAPLAGAGAILISLRPLAHLVRRWAQGPGTLRGFIRDSAHHVLNVMTWRTGAFAAALTIGSWTLSISAVFAFFAVQPGGGLSWGQSTLVFAAMTFAAAIPALPAGIGLVQAAVVVALQPLGYSFAHAVAIAIALHAGQVLLAATLGPVILGVRSTGVSALIRDALNARNAARLGEEG